MSSKRWDIRPKKGGGGAGKVTEEEKNSVINKAVSKWKEMGLSREEIALGIATMNVESGLNSSAKNPDGSAKGLGQFNYRTWKRAVKYYNKQRAKGEPKLDPESNSSRWDTDGQIKVMGQWLEYVHHIAVGYSIDPRLMGYGINEIAYALWHLGDSAKIGSSDEELYSIRKFLSKDFNARKEFKETYDKVWGDMLTGQDANAADGMPQVEDVLTPGVMDRVMEILFPSFTEPYSGAGANSNGTLERDAVDYRRVWRIEPDRSTRGFFVS
ncbi:MAG: hypothetical protein HZB83_04330 [Deltaproteobacteria bacterium]|nr:hypothetical protein [Deltaproteobacteria bacterium]